MPAEHQSLFNFLSCISIELVRLQVPCSAPVVISLNNTKNMPEVDAMAIAGRHPWVTGRLTANERAIKPHRIHPT